MQAAALEQSENFSKTLLQAQENERKRIASELHDSVGQKLILIKNKVLLIQTEESLRNKSFVQSLPQTVAETIEEVRLISYGLRPYQIDLLGLTQSIRSLVTEAFDTLNLVYTLHIDNIDHLVARENEINIYRIIQECLNNIIKHAAATHCTIMIKAGAGISISIEDNGIGIKADAGKTKGLGLWSIQERVQLAGGVLQIKNAVPHGLLIEISIPTQA